MGFKFFTDEELFEMALKKVIIRGKVSNLPSVASRPKPYSPNDLQGRCIYLQLHTILKQATLSDSSYQIGWVHYWGFPPPVITPSDMRLEVTASAPCTREGTQQIFENYKVFPGLWKGSDNPGEWMLADQAIITCCWEDMKWNVDPGLNFIVQEYRLLLEKLKSQIGDRAIFQCLFDRFKSFADEKSQSNWPII